MLKSRSKMYMTVLVMAGRIAWLDTQRLMLSKDSKRGIYLCFIIVNWLLIVGGFVLDFSSSHSLFLLGTPHAPMLLSISPPQPSVSHICTHILLLLIPQEPSFSLWVTTWKGTVVSGAHILRSSGPDDQRTDRPGGPGAPDWALHAAAQPGVGWHHQPGHAERWGAEGPRGRQTARQHSQDQRQGMQSPWAPLCRAGKDFIAPAVGSCPLH